MAGGPVACVLFPLLHMTEPEPGPNSRLLCTRRPHLQSGDRGPPATDLLCVLLHLCAESRKESGVWEPPPLPRSL